MSLNLPLENTPTGLADGLAKVLSGHVVIATAGTDYISPSESYDDPDWITGLDGSKISGVISASISGANVTGNIAGNANSITGSIAESQVTGLVADLAAKASVASLSAYSTTSAIAAAYQPLDADLTAIAAISGTGGAPYRTAAGTWALRTPQGTANQVVVTNGDGVAGNPTFSLPSTIAPNTTSGADATIQSTSHATKGRLFLNGSSAYVSATGVFTGSGTGLTGVALTASANAFTAAQSFFKGVNFGFSATTADMASACTNLYLRRDSNVSGWMWDYCDEAYYLDLRGTTTVTPTPDTGSLSSIFRDDSNFIQYNGSTSPWPIVIAADLTAAPIAAKNNGSYAIGLTFRSGGSALTAVPTHIKIEYWNSAAGGSYSTVFDQDVSIASVLQGWVSPTLSTPDSSANLLKFRVTLSGTNPLGASDSVRIQRLQVYHPTASWDTWHLSVGGGTLYGDTTLNDGVNLVAGTTTGSKIGTSAAQKLGFWGATPVVRPVLSYGRAASGETAALAAIRAALAAAGIVTDSTTA